MSEIDALKMAKALRRRGFSVRVDLDESGFDVYVI